jgi:hypothetical protein
MSLTNPPQLTPETALLLRRKHIEAVLIACCWEDEAFRRRLLADPKGTVAEAFGAELAPWLTVTVQPESPDALVLVLPARPTQAELSDLDLEQVVGGQVSQGSGPSSGSPTSGAATPTAPSPLPISFPNGW